MNIIKTLSGIFAVAGLFWAYFAFIGVVMSFASAVMIFAGEKTPLGYVLLYFQAWCGFFIWFGWIARALDVNYLIKRKTFWILSLLHHLIWLVPMLIGLAQKGIEDGMAMFIYTYVFAATIFSVIGIFIDKEKMKAEPAGAINSEAAAAPR